ncbi:MAG TPA: DUF3501 family protein [Frankiaceae bacterium]|jgi:hypothetical protein|nr:DUF3501 family protein [Frankiaceae bacterium]
MKKITLDDLDLDLAAYGARRAEARSAAIALKKQRRISLGDVVTLVFENRDTLRHQVQEMLFVEQTTDLAKVGEELDVYNPLMPTPNELSATLFLELPDMATLKAELPRLAGIEHCFSLDVGGSVAKAVGEEGRSREDYTATVHYLRFPLTDEQRDAFRDPSVPVEVAVDHPNYADSTPIPEAMRLSLLADLALD